MAKAVELAIIPFTHRFTLAYEVTIRAVSELTVGGGSLEQATSPFDIAVAKMPIGDKLVPYIPASTVKGLLRAIAEEAVREMCGGEVALYDVLKAAELDGEDKEVRREFVEKVVGKALRQFFDEKAVEDVERKLAEGYGDFVRGALPREPEVEDVLKRIRVTPHVCNPVVEGLACELPIRRYKEAYLKALKKAANVDRMYYPCPVCRTFGAPGYASNVHVTNFYPEGELGVNYFILTRRHVAIDRTTGAAAEGKLFEMEYVTPGATFKGYILVKGKPAGNISGCPSQLTGDEVPDYVVRLALEKAKRALLGRRKSAGMGEVEVEYTPVSSNTQCPPWRPLGEICQWVKGAVATI